MPLPLAIGGALGASSRVSRPAVRRFIRGCALAFALLLVLAAGFVWYLLDLFQTRATVVNASGAALYEVVLVADDQRHTIGTMVAGERRTLRVSPTEANGLELRFRDASGPHRHEAGYIEAGGYRCTLTVKAEGQVDEVITLVHL